MKKRVTALILCLVMVLIVSGCKTTSKTSSSKTSSNTTTSVSGETTESTASGETNKATVNSGDVSKTASKDTSGLTVSKNKITLKVALKTNPVNGNIAKMWFWSEMEKLTNIHFDVSAIDASVFHDRKVLMIMSNQLPDMFLGYAEFDSGEVYKYGSQGVFVDIKNQVKNMPNLQNVLKNKPNTLKGAISPNGAIYSLPCFNTRSKADGTRIYINTTWLENLGLNMPTTLNELHNVLVAFRDRDPDGDGVKNTIPLSSIGYSALPIFMNAYGYVDDWDVKSGKVSYFPMQPEYKEYMNTLNVFYTENLIDHDMFTQSDEQFKAKAKAMKIGVFAYGSPDTAVGSDKEKWSQYEALTPVKAKSGIDAKFALSDGIYQNTAMITKTNKYIKESVKFLDFLYSETGTTMLRIGPEKGKWTGKGGWYVDNGGKTILEKPATSVDTWSFINSVSPAINILPCWMPSKIMQSMKGDEASTHLAKQNDKVFANGRYTMPEFTYTAQETTDYNNIMPYVSARVSSEIPDYIIGVKAPEEIANSQTALKQMGIEKLIKIKQAAYNRYMSN